MLNGVTESRFSVTTQQLHRLKLHTVNFMQTKKLKKTQANLRIKYLKPKYNGELWMNNTVFT